MPLGGGWPYLRCQRALLMKAESTKIGPSGLGPVSLETSDCAPIKVKPYGRDKTWLAGHPF
jgi:hypothetical protein